MEAAGAELGGLRGLGPEGGRAAAQPAFSRCSGNYSHRPPHSCLFWGEICRWKRIPPGPVIKRTLGQAQRKAPEHQGRGQSPELNYHSPDAPLVAPLCLIFQTVDPKSCPCPTTRTPLLLHLPTLNGPLGTNLWPRSAYALCLTWALVCSVLTLTLVSLGIKGSSSSQIYQLSYFSLFSIFLICSL